MFVKLLSVLSVTLFVTLTLGQQQAPQLGPCSLGLDGEMQLNCMQNNGVDYNGTLFIISSNRTGALPPGYTYDGFRQLMCQPDKQDLIVPCILQLMQKWNKTSCADEDRYIMTLKGGQILGLMEGFCSEPCMGAAMQTLVQCFAAVQVNPSPILNENATILTDKFGFVGNDSENSVTFCDARSRLFTCLSPLSKECPPLVTRLYTLGIDLDGMERATDYLCKDVDAYVKAEDCVTSDKPALVGCTTTTDPTLTKIIDDRYRTGLVKPSQYQGKLCEAKLAKVSCQIKNMNSACGATTATLFSTHECTSIPAPCRTGAGTKATYEGLCSQVTTPAPTVTQRPTPPPKTLNPGSSTNTGGVGGLGGGANSVGDASEIRFVLVSMVMLAVSILVM